MPSMNAALKKRLNQTSNAQLDRQVSPENMLNLVTDPDENRVKDYSNPLDCSYQVRIPKEKKLLDETMPGS
jgi:hypothetical protein